MTVGVVIPAYNAEQTLTGVIERIPAELRLDRLWIVNDGSHDNTAGLARTLLARNNASWDHGALIDLPRNHGYGGAMKRGLRAALDAGMETVVCLHADGQYAPEEMPGMLADLDQRQLAILQGSRLAGGTRAALSGGMPLYKAVAGQALTALENRVLGLSMTDYHSGFLVFAHAALTQIRFEQLSDSFDFDLEMIASARALNLRVGERPIPTHYGEEISHLHPLTYGLRVLRVMFNFVRGRYHRLAR